MVLQTLDVYQDLEGKHGPGAVAEGLKSNQKWLYFTTCLSDLDSKLEDIGYDLPYGLFADRIFETCFSNVLPSLSARLVTVPKSSTSLRTITVEPCLNQFVQQAYNSHLRKEIEKCRILRHSLKLNSQEPNQKLALESSITGDWVTVDLSSASDLLSLHLVEAVFANRPKFLRGILNCRTPSVDLGKGPVYLKKYAGMGNATTFPVQSVVFAVLAIASMTDTHEILSEENLVRKARCVRVFGDDIIIKTEHFPAFARWIDSVGLRINRDKTFTKGNFRESCGMDAYQGTKVTPIYLRHDPSNTSTDARSLMSVLSTCNQLWLDGMYSTSDCLKFYLKKFKLPLVDQDSPGLGYHTHQNLCVRQRWSPTLHRFEVKTYVPSPVREKDEIDGYPALMKFFHSPRSAEFDRNHMSSSVRRFNTNLRKRWVPTG